MAGIEATDSERGGSARARDSFESFRSEPATMPACTYCDAPVENHDPVCVCECDDGTGSSIDARFCNYACLVQHVEEAGLTLGASCEWSPDGAGDRC
ncbi:hypothetical protein [Haloglomus salinum]|uniref:hypothetical protein n=1 Tax=Haloglomus salinum TaxID=2962673 RepID=UPI0020C9D4B9|nr:hypothetical protein [Haloglomus salinum]